MRFSASPFWGCYPLYISDMNAEPEKKPAIPVTVNTPNISMRMISMRTLDICMTMKNTPNAPGNMRTTCIRKHIITTNTIMTMRMKQSSSI